MLTTMAILGLLTAKSEAIRWLRRWIAQKREKEMDTGSMTKRDFLSDDTVARDRVVEGSGWLTECEGLFVLLATV